MQKHFYTLLLSLISLAAVAQKNAPVILNPGQEIKATITLDQDTDMGMGMSMNMKTKTEANLKVQKVMGDKYILSSKLTHLKTEVDGMGQNQTFDSDKKEDMDSEKGEPFKDIFKDENYFSLNKITGEITEVDKEGTIVKEDEEDNSADVMMQMNAEAINKVSQFKTMVTCLPANVKPGYSWIDSATVNGIHNESTNTVTKVENGIAYIDIKGITKGSTSVTMQDQNMDVTINGTITGKGEVNIKTNLTRMQNLVTDVSSSVDVMGQTMNMTTKGTTTTTYQ